MIEENTEKSSHLGNTLPKRERLHLKNDIDRLIGGGKFGTLPGMKYSFIPESAMPYNRIMISVPKKLFRRAVKRNLLKRRIREAYRTRKSLLPQKGIDILFIYSTKEVLTQKEIDALIEKSLTEISSRLTKSGILP